MLICSRLLASPSGYVHVVLIGPLRPRSRRFALWVHVARRPPASFTRPRSFPATSRLDRPPDAVPAHRVAARALHSEFKSGPGVDLLAAAIGKKPISAIGHGLRLDGEGVAIKRAKTSRSDEWRAPHDCRLCC